MTSITVQPVKKNFSQTTNNELRKRLGRKSIQRFGRFYRVRQGYSILQKQIQNFNGSYDKLCKYSLSTTAFNTNVDECIANMRNLGVHLGLQLSNDSVRKIYNFASSQTCTEPKYKGKFFANEINSGRLENLDRYIMRGLVDDPNKCAQIEEIVRDPLLLEIAHKYLGYCPNTITRHLTWSFSNDLPEKEIQRHYPPTNFHYDVAGLNFVTVSFYITDVDEETGSHIMFTNSHQQKPLSLLLKSNILSEEEVKRHYHPEQMLTITGKAGFGFFQDPNCIHRLKPPTKGLILQIRYS